jgi:predicted nucleotidyltransferase
MKGLDINPYLPALRELARKWKIQELYLFGSATTSNFTSKSDIDLLVVFQEGIVYGLDFVDFHDELVELFNRPVDVIEKKVIEKSNNPYRKSSILNSAVKIYDQAA